MGKLKNKYIKAGMGYTISNYLIKGIAFITLPIFARLMSKSEYGLFNSFIAYSSLFSILLSLALHASYKNAKIKFTNKSSLSEDRYNEYVAETMILISVNMIIWIILAIILRNFIFKYLGLDIISSIILVIYSWASSILLCYNADIGLHYKYKNFLIVAGFNAITSVFLSLYLMLGVFKSDHYIGRVIGVLIPILIIAIIILFKQLRNGKVSHFKGDMTWGIKYSLPLVPHGISQIILSQFDRIMILNMVGAIPAGIYSFAYNIFSIVVITSQSLDNVWGPWFYERLANHEYEKIKKISSYYILLILFVTAVAMLMSPELILLLGSRKYFNSIYCVIPIVAGGFFSFMYTIPASVEYYHEKTKYIAVATMIAAFLNIVLNYIFILKYGYIAAAYTTLFTYFLYFCFHLFVSIKIENKLIFSSRIIILSSIAVIVLSIISLMTTSNIFIRYIIIIILMIFYICYFYKKDFIGVLKDTGLRKEKNNV